MSSRNATGLIAALMNAGDHSSALQYAKQYEALVTKELGVGAGPAVATLVDEVRAKAGTEPLSSLPSARLTAQEAPPAAPLAAPSAAPVEHRPQPTSARRRSLPFLIPSLVALVVLAIAASLRPKTRDTTVLPSAKASIAVLPFANVSGAPEDAAFVDGLTEELIGALAKLGHLRVIGRTSVFTFKNTGLDARQIGDSLGVANILEGGVQIVGSHLHVQVGLIDVRDGSTRWSETYNRELRDFFAVQSDIAGAVARALDLQLGATTLAAIRRGSTSNIAAHEMYLRGNDPALMRTDSTTRVALDYFNRAVALDSEYAAAYAGVARAQANLPADGAQEVRDRLAERAALKAVALGDSVGDAHAALGGVRKSNYDLVGAEMEFRRAVALEPNTARFREYLVQLYVTMERSKDALLEAQRALELDPLSPTANAEFARALIANNRCGEALMQLDKLKSLQPVLRRAGALAAQCYARKKMWPQAIAEMQWIAGTAPPRAKAVLGYLLARSGRPNEARQVLAAMLDRERRLKTGAFEVATVYAGLGDNDQAFAWLDKSFDDRSLNFENMIPLEGLRDDPRYDRFRKRLNGQKR
jgi:TolB-like protein/Tfp pilus assembly protein PilF